MHSTLNRRIAAVSKLLGLLPKTKVCRSTSRLPEVHDSLQTKPWLANWRHLVSQESDLWSQGRRQQKHKILIGSIAGGHPVCVAIETLIAAALTLRGSEVEVLLCDGALPACLQCTADQFSDLKNFAKEGPQNTLCSPCFASGLSAFESLGLKIRRLGDYITPADRKDISTRVSLMTLKEIDTWKDQLIGFGEQTKASALRFFATGDLQGEELGIDIARRYAEAALLTQLAASRLFEVGKYESLFINHGIYVPHGIVKETAQSMGIRSTIWDLAAKASCIHVAHDDAVLRLLNEPNAAWENMQWSEAAENELMDYLQSRGSGSLDWIYPGMHAGSQTHKDQFSSEFKIDFNKPTIGLLTNVVWDAALFYPGLAFPTLMEWIAETIRYFAAKPQLNLVIRVHPAEVRGNMISRQTALGEIKKMFPVLPENVYIVPPESHVNTYALMRLCDTAIIYGTTTGVELTSMGIPVITTGQAFIRGKGITLDASSREEYLEMLDRLPLGKRMSNAERTRARMYAFNLYFRRSIPISFAELTAGWPPMKMNISSLKQLLPGANLGVDVICDGILEGKDFLYPAEDVLERTVPETVPQEMKPGRSGSE